MATISKCFSDIQECCKDHLFTVTGDIDSYKEGPDKNYALVDLIDEINKLRVYIPGNLLKSCGHQLDAGLRVEVSGRLSIFNDSIQLTAVATHILGKSTKKASARAILDPYRKKRLLPPFIKAVAVVTGENSKARGDFESNIHASVQTQLFTSIMGGPRCPENIKKQVELINQSSARFDCIVIIRGGDDEKELEIYNDPILVNAILNSKLPVLTSIGHDADEFDCDKAADNTEKLSTPTSVANFINKHNYIYIKNLKEQDKPVPVWPETKKVLRQIPYAKILILFCILYFIFQRFIK